MSASVETSFTFPDGSPNMPEQIGRASWAHAEVASPRLDRPVPVVVSRDLPTIPSGNRFQSLNLYLPARPETLALVGTPVTALPRSGAFGDVPYQVHVHGGAWRDPNLSATSIEAAVAHAFVDPAKAPVAAIASLNYTLTHYPTHPTKPYDARTGDHADPAREAVHPQHVGDVLRGLALLRALGLQHDGFVLTGHSCGACLAFQAILQSPSAYGLDGVADAPRPAAMIGLNGLYDLPALVHDLGAAHAHLEAEYRLLISNAFGSDEVGWPGASPARFDPAAMAARVRDGRAPRLVLLDGSREDQLVPMNQLEHLEAVLKGVDGLRVVRGRRCVGPHAAPWEQGDIINDSLHDVLDMLARP